MFIDIGHVSPTWYFVAMALAVLIIGIAKTGFGGGIGILAVPLTANVLPAQTALGVLLPILIAADIFAVWTHRGQQSWPHLRRTLSGAAIGIAIGTAMIVWFRIRGSEVAQTQAWIATVLKLIVGIVCLLLVLIQCYRLTGMKLPRIPDTRASGVSAGALSGFVSMLAHGAGPIMSVFLLEQQMAKRLMVGTLVVFFFIVNIAKLPSYVALGWITGPTLAESGMCILLVPVGSLIGLWLHKRVPQRPFTLIMYLGAAAASANMIYKAIESWSSL